MDHLLSKEQPRRKARAKVKSRDRHETVMFRIPSVPVRDAKRGAAQLGGIAQLVERQLCKLDVAGSSPTASTILKPFCPADGGADL